MSRQVYFLTAVAVSLLLSLAAVAIAWFMASRVLGLDVPLPTPDEDHWLLVFLGMVVLAPLAETLILAMAVGAARLASLGEAMQILTGALPIGMAHVFRGEGAGDGIFYAIGGTVAFLAFAAVYVVWRRESFRDAYWMSCAVHALHNGVVVVSMVLSW